MTFSTISVAVLVNEIQPISDKQSIATTTFKDRNTGNNYAITLDLYGKNVELGSMLVGKMALVSGTFKLINKVLTVNVTTICPAAIPGFSSVNLLMRLGKDPDFNSTGATPRVSCFGLVNYAKDQPASGFGVSFFGKKAELVSKYVKKGNLLGILGKLNAYGKEGENPNIGINGVELFLMPKSTNSNVNEVEDSNQLQVVPTGVSSDWDSMPF